MVQTNLLWASEFGDDYLSSSAKSDNADVQLQDQMEIVIDTEPHTLFLTARFDKDATLFGLGFFEGLPTLMMEGFDW